MRESKTTRFKRLAENRVNKAIRMLRLVGNLSNRNNYDFEDDQVKKIVDALTAEVHGIKRRFQEALDKQESRFIL